MHSLNSLEQMKLRGCIEELTPSFSSNTDPRAFYSAHLFFHSPHLAMMDTWGMVLLRWGKILGQGRMLFLIKGSYIDKEKSTCK